MASLMEKTLDLIAFDRVLRLSRLRYTELEVDSSQRDITRNWRPVTLRPKLLSILIAFPLIAVAIIEYLSSRSRKNGGIVFAAHEFSGFTNFSYQYLPTIIAVVFSMTWAWIDLDTKRLEPYFQMSKAEGVSPSKSILLHYPLDFVIIPPIEAIRLRHWAVVVAGISSGLIFCGVTPLIGAVFEARRVNHWAVGNVTLTASLPHVVDGSPLLTNGFMMNAYSNLWLNQELPSFTTGNGSLIPFEIKQNTDWPSFQSTWTAQIEMYSSSLDCQPANVKNGSYSVTYDNGKGCVIKDVDISGLIPNKTSLFTSYYGANCSSANASQPFVAFSFKNQQPSQNMKSLDPPDYNDPEQIDPDIEGNTQYNVSLRWSTFWEKTVLFCEPSYYIQSVNATLMVPNMTVSNIQLLASPQQLPQEQFNIPDFESMVGSDSSKNITGRDINETIKQIDTTQLDNLGVTDLIGNMIIFAVGSEHLELDEYLNPSVLAASLDKAYGLLFALAVNSVLSPNNSNSDNTSGTIQGETNAIAVVRTLAIPLEVCLSLVAIMTILLLLVCWNRRSQLCKDPDSLSNVLELTQNDPKVPSVAKSAEQGCDESGLTLRNGRLRVSAWEENLPISATSTSLTISEHVQGGSSKNKPVRPFVMGTLAGATFLMVLSLALITILALWFCVQNRDGLPIPSRHPLLTQIVLNYLPVVFATLLEPFWTLLNRKLCILKPFEELGNGKARAFQSIDLKYTSLPPQLIIWRALKARHFLLMAVCGIGLSTNILAVALNALLDTQVRAVEFDGTFLKTSLPVINPFPLDTTSSDHLYIAAANFSHGTPLPAWVAEDLFFLPFQINATSPLGSVESYKANTWGFGLVTNCTKIDWDNPGWIAQDKGEVGSPQVNINQSSVECMRLWDTFYESSNKTNGALELIAPFGPNDDKATSEEHEICGSVLTAGFLRAELNAELEGVDSLVTSSQWMTCQSDLVTALYEVEVDNSGRVESYIRQSSDSTDISFAGNASLNSILSNLFLAFDAPFNKQPNWRDGTYEDSWFGFLIKALTKSTKLIDPSLPAPGFYDSSRVVEEVLVRLFPIILSLRPTAFVPAPTGSTIKGKMMVPCDRVFMSRPMFILVVILLLWNIVVAAAYYLYRPRPMPTGVADTIASVLALFDGSGLVKEQSVDRPWPEDWTFGYGNFIGENDGKPRLGIERRPFVVPLVDKKRT